MLALVSAGGVDGGAGEDFAAAAGADDGVVVVDQDDDLGAGVGSADDPRLQLTPPNRSGVVKEFALLA